MTKKRTNPRQIRAEIEAKASTPRSLPILVDKLLSCGHHALVPPGLDPAKAICEGCKQDALCSGYEAASSEGGTNGVQHERKG